MILGDATATAPTATATATPYCFGVVQMVANGARTVAGTVDGNGKREETEEFWGAIGKRNR